MLAAAEQMAKRTFSFRGRASRAEFWTIVGGAGVLFLPAFMTEFRWFFLDVSTQAYIITQTSLISGQTSRFPETVTTYVFTFFAVQPTWVTLVPVVVTTIPLLAALVRRLHDLGRPAWWGLVALFLVFGLRPLVSVLFFALPSTVGALFALFLGFPSILLTMAALIVLVLWTSNEGDPGDNQFGPGREEVSHDIL
ncbi:MAG: DUF805 domain-containing protein [Roseicyclus sp.]|nr:DUF805 domain-containing protein [Roseicyclus sp.]